MISDLLSKYSEEVWLNFMAITYFSILWNLCYLKMSVQINILNEGIQGFSFLLFILSHFILWVSVCVCVRVYK
jgi:hypothetical protein